MDLSSVKPVDRRVDIKHPVTREDTGLVFVLKPYSDPSVKAVQRRLANTRLRNGRKITAEQLEDAKLEVLCAAVSGWEWNGEATFGGEKLEFNAANVRKVLKSVDWIREQVDEELGDDAAFFGD